VWLRAVAAALAVAIVAAAPRSDDPDWPCQQRLVPRLTAAAYWNRPLDAPGDWRADPEVAALVRRLAPRRVTTQEGLTAISAFAKAQAEDGPHRLALVFRGLLEETDGERAELIEKLKQIGRRQRELAELVGRFAEDLRSLPADADAERVDLQQRHDFTARNFAEVQRTIRYACEAPVGLDARLGAWARALQAAAQP
jgi:hypothetical protein